MALYADIHITLGLTNESSSQKTRNCGDSKYFSPRERMRLKYELSGSHDIQKVEDFMRLEYRMHAISVEAVS